MQTPELATVRTGPESPNLPPHPAPYSCVNLKCSDPHQVVHWKTRLAKNRRQLADKAPNPSLNVYQSLLTQTDTELRLMNNLLQQTQSRKTQLAQVLCKYLSPSSHESVHKPRNTVEVAAPNRIADLILKSLKESQHAVCLHIRKSTPNITSYRGFTSIQQQPVQRPLAASQPTFYDQELTKLLAEAKVPAGSVPHKAEVLRQVLHTDLTGYGHNKRGMILFVNFKYDFPVANPLPLLAARWNFVQKEQQIVDYVEKRRDKRRKESKAKFHAYKKAYDEWRYRNRKLDLQANGDLGELRCQKRVDIYGREAHGLVCSPKFPLLSGTAPDVDLLGSSMMSQLRKESLELDSDLCKY